MRSLDRLSEIVSLSSASNSSCDASSSTKLLSTTKCWAGTGEISHDTHGAGGDPMSSNRECPAELSVAFMSRSEFPDTDGVGNLTHTHLCSTSWGAEWPQSPRPELLSKWSGTCLSTSWKWAGFQIVCDATAGDESIPVCLVTGGGKHATVPEDLWPVTFLPNLAFERGDWLATGMLLIPALPLTSDKAD